jgi:asparagine synthase (glutamine-hydrolysing)
MGLNEKYVLKRSFQDIIPEKITKRPKHPYRAPIKQSLLNEKISGYVYDTLSDRRLSEAGLFDVPKVKMLLKKLQDIETPGEVDSMALAGILSTQLVVDKFINNFSVMVASLTHGAKNIIVDNRKIFK